MASIAMTIIPSDFSKVSCGTRSGQLVSSSCYSANIRYCNVQQDMCRSLLFSYKPLTRCLIKPVSATGPGFQAPIDDEELTPVKARVIVESQDEETMQVRVDVRGRETEKIFNSVLEDLASTAPAIPGFRKQKGGKTTEVPKDFLINSIGETRVNQFVIQEIVCSTMADYTEKENLKVKEKKVDTIQTIEELMELFTPGRNFRFNVKLVLEKTETEETVDSSTTEETLDSGSTEETEDSGSTSPYASASTSTSTSDEE